VRAHRLCIDADEFFNWAFNFFSAVNFCRVVWLILVTWWLNMENLGLLSHLNANQLTAHFFFIGCTIVVVIRSSFMWQFSLSSYLFFLSNCSFLLLSLSFDKSKMT